MNAWYVRVRGQVSGPYTLDQLRLQRERGQLGRLHEISEDRETWKRATSLSDLFPETRDSSTGDAGGSRTDSTGELKAEPRKLPGAPELPQQPSRPGAKANAGHGTPPSQLTQASRVNRSRAFWVAAVGAAAAILGVVVAVVVGWGVWSGRGDKGNPARNQVDTPVFAAPTLYEPKPGAVLANGPGKYIWEFRWSDVSGADGYEICRIPPGAAKQSVTITTEVSEPFLRYESNGYVADHNLKGWQWKVRAIKGDQESDWSEVRTFDVEALKPQRTPQPITNGPPSVEDASAKKTQQQQQFTNSIGMNLTLIPAGEFMMGSPDAEPFVRKGEKPQHRVRITKPFYMGVYEVTQAEYAKVMGSNPSSFSSTGPSKDRVARMDTSRFPVEMVSWDDAADFCKRLYARPDENRARRLYRLPTEAEWEYACSAGTTTPFHFGNVASSKHANFNPKFPNGGAADGPYLERTTPVGSYAPNAWGLYDMHGNVAEWCSDRYDPNYYVQRVEVDPQGPAAAPDDRHVLRGGAWLFFGLDCRSACRERFENQTQIRDLIYGFRVVCETDASMQLAAAGDQTRKAQQDTDAGRVKMEADKKGGDSGRKKTETEKKNVEKERPAKSKLSLNCTVEKKRSTMGPYFSMSLNITVKGNIKEDQTVLLTLKNPENKERQIAQITQKQMTADSYDHSQSITLYGWYEVTLKDSEGKVLASKNVKAVK